jgi:hypothetical protein
MPSMVNANRFINMGAIPLVIVAYAVFLWIDHKYYDSFITDPDIEDHIQNIKNSGSVDGLVFGGSNAIFSLSAESLSYYTGAKWYNASLLNEMGRINRYKNFIRDLSARIDRTKVKYVVYSSKLPYSTGTIAAYELEEKLNGVGIKPNNSVLGYIMRYARPRKRSPNSFGDIIFDGVKCAFNGRVNHEREKEDVSVDFLVDKAIFFASVFPNASILIVLPSEYYGGVSFDDSIFEQTLRTKFYSVLAQKYLTDTMVKIIFQPPYSSIAQVCDQQMHANEDGRLWRTRNLIEFMREIVPTNRAMMH